MSDYQQTAVNEARRRRIEENRGGMERRTLLAGSQLEARTDLEHDDYVVDGYFTTFSDLYDMGTHFEQVDPQALTRTLSESPDITFLCDHGRSLSGIPMARAKSPKGGPGTMMVHADARGGRFQAHLDREDPDAQALMRAVKSGRMWQCSFSFRCLSDSWDDARNVRTLKVLSLHGGDISCVSAPANPNTTIIARDVSSVPRIRVPDYTTEALERLALRGVRLPPRPSRSPADVDPSDFYRRRMAEIRSRSR